MAMTGGFVYDPLKGGDFISQYNEFQGTPQQDTGNLGAMATMTGADGTQGNWTITGSGDTQQSVWTPHDAAWQQRAQSQADQGPSQAYNFQGWNNNTSGLSSLDANAFTQNASGGWDNPFVNTMMNTAGKGSIRYGLDALLNGTQDMSEFTGVQGRTPTNDFIGDSTWRNLAQMMGISTSSPGWQDQVRKQADNFVMLKGMGSLNPNDARQMNQLLYRKNDNGGWDAVLNKNWHEREKGSWWDEGGSMMMVPLSIVAGGLGAAAAGSAAGGAAGAGAAGGGITGTGGALGSAAYGSVGSLGSTLGTAGTGSLGAGLAGAAGTGSALTTVGAAGAAGGLGGTLANALGYGQEFSSLPSWAQGAINQGLQGAGNSIMQGKNPLEGALTGAVTGGVMPGVNSAIGDLGLGNTISGGLSGGIRGGLSGLLSGGNPLTGAVTGSAGGLTGGGLRDLGANSQLANLGSQYASQFTGGAINNAIQNEVSSNRTEFMNDLYSQAQSRGISRQQLDAVLATPQGRATLQRLMAQQGKGTLQSLFG